MRISRFDLTATKWSLLERQHNSHLVSTAASEGGFVAGMRLARGHLGALKVIFGYPEIPRSGSGYSSVTSAVVVAR